MGVLKAKVDGAWVEVGGSGSSADVLWTGPDAPTDPTIELWADTDATASPSGGYPLVSLSPFSVAGWTWVNQGAAAYSENSRSVVMTCPSAAAEQNRILVTALPVGTPTIVLGLVPWLYAVDLCFAGLTLRESATGKLVHLTVASGAGTLQIAGRRCTSPSAFASNAAGIVAFKVLPPLLFFRVRILATQYALDWSFDGLNFIAGPGSLTENKNAFFTTGPDQVGIFMQNSCGTTSYASFIHWSQT